MDMELHIQRLEHAVSMPMPRYGSDGAAGIDLAAAIEGSAALTIWPGERRMIPTGFAIEIPAGHVGILAVRSSLSKHGIALANGVGIIDSDYRGEVKVNLAHFGERCEGGFDIHRGDRIAQLLVIRVRLPTLVEVESLSDTQRGEGGFGSTGVQA